MRATRLIVLGAASHVCCGQSLYHRDLDTICRPPGNGRHVHSRPPQASRRGEAPPPSWLVSGGGAEETDDEPPTRWWRSRKRWAKRQAEKKAAEERQAASSSAVAQMARKHVIAVQGMLRRLKRLLGLILDIATLKRLRLLRQARQVRRPAVCFVCSMHSEYVLQHVLHTPGSTEWFWFPHVTHASCCGVCTALLGLLYISGLRLSRQKIQKVYLCR